MKDRKSVASVALAAWRESRKITQMEAAIELQVAQTRYSDYERGTAVPGRKASVNIEAVTGIPPADWDRPVRAARVTAKHKVA